MITYGLDSLPLLKEAEAEDLIAAGVRPFHAKTLLRALKPGSRARTPVPAGEGGTAVAGGTRGGRVVAGDSDRFFAQSIIAPTSGTITYIPMGFVVHHENIQEFCRDMKFITSGDMPGLSLLDCWASAKKRISLDKDTPRISPDHAQTLHAYTVECNLYKNLNRIMREGNMEQLCSSEYRSYMDFIYFLQTALSSATQLAYRPDQCLYRGIRHGISADHYKPNSIITWHSFSSTTKSMDVALSFAGGSPDQPAGTLFVIVDPKTARGISVWSQYPEEEEWLYTYNTQFKVMPCEMESFVLRDLLMDVDTSKLNILILKEI
uniref:NAD(P)(+)--arginine ADP-ribosyltransferase n=1 Tax=Eutreptiella gymnastica TaxID=73025 RepID=A0A7S1NMB6_9EUGL